jgi:hypothetical protein
MLAGHTRRYSPQAREPLEYTFWLSLMNRYRDFDRATEAALDLPLKHYGVGIDAVQREALI